MTTKKMILSNKKVKILFILIINISLLIPFIIYSKKYFTKSYIIRQKHLVLVDSVSFKYVSGEITITKGSRRIEMTSVNNQQFRIWNTFIDAIKDKQLFLEKVKNPRLSAIVYSDLNSAENYKKGKGFFTTIKQIEIEKVKLIDLDKVNLFEKNITLRYIFLCPIFALLLTLFMRHKLLRRA